MNTKMFNSDEFWIEVGKNLDFRESHFRIIPTWIFLVTMLICGILLFHKIFVAFNWFDILLFLIAIQSLYIIGKHDGYPEGYRDGSEDTRDIILDR